jgi:hypothetical protein
MKCQLTRDDILHYFELLNEELKKSGEFGEIIIAGGAALALAYSARESTYDIDAIFEPKESFNRMIKKIAEENDIADDWLNDGIKGFFTAEMKYNEILSFTNLRISSMDAETMLALKLTSARSLSKDMEDSIFLMKHLNIQSEDKLFEIIDKYIPKHRQTAQSYFFTKESYSQYCEIEKILELEDEWDHEQ